MGGWKICGHFGSETREQSELGSLSTRSPFILLLPPLSFLHSLHCPIHIPPPPFHPLSSLPYLSFTGREVSSFCLSSDGMRRKTGKLRPGITAEKTFILTYNKLL